MFVPTRKRKLNAEPTTIYDYPIQKKPGDPALIDQVRVITFENFQKILAKEKSDTTNAIVSLKKASTLIKDTETGSTVHHRLWIEVPKGELDDNREIIWLDLTITKRNSKYLIEILEDGKNPKLLISTTYDKKNNELHHNFFKGRQISKGTSSQLSEKISLFFRHQPENNEFDSINVVTIENLYTKLDLTERNFQERYQCLKKICSPILNGFGTISNRLWIELGQDRWLQMFLEEESNKNININLFDSEDESSPIASLSIDQNIQGLVSGPDRKNLETISKIANLLLLNQTFFPESGFEEEKNVDSITCFDALKTHLSKQYSDFISAWQNLTDQCSNLDKHNQFRLDLALNENLTFNLILSKEHYFSSAMTEEQLYPHSLLKNHFYFLSIYQNGNFSQSVLKMRFDENGKAELIWLEKSYALSGNEMKTLAYSITKYFRVENLFLHDDAKIKLKVLSKEELPYRKSMYLSTIKALSTDGGDTWYTKDGFTPIKCRNLALFNKKEQANQEPELYFASLEYLRGVPLIKLGSLIFPLQHHKLAEMHKKYCSDIPYEKATMHNLLKSMSAKLIESQSKNDKIISDFATIYENFIEPPQRVKANIEMAKWKLALEVVNEHYIFVKDFRASSVENYAKFISKPHTTFSELVQDFKLEKLTYSELINLNTI